MKKLGVIIFMMIVGNVYANPFIGTWVYRTSVDDYAYSCHFNSDGSAIFYNKNHPIEGHEVNWKFIDSYLMIGNICYSISFCEGMFFLEPMEGNYIIEMEKISNTTSLISNNLVED